MLAVLTLCLLSCSENLFHAMGPRSPAVQDSAAIPPVIREGCAVFEVHVAAGKASADVTPSPSCGPIVPTIAGLIGYDITHGVVTIPIAIKNEGRLKAHSPMAVFARLDSITVINSTRAGAQHPSFVQPTGVGDGVAGGRITWSFDHNDANTTTEPVGPAMVSPARAISVTVPRNATALRVVLRARATNVFTVPMRAPASTPDSVLREQHDSAHIAHNANVKYAADKLYVVFKRDATMEDRQAAIDAVDGTVIGGAPPEYFVRIPTLGDRSGAAVLHAIERLRKQPGVDGVTIDMLTPPSPDYLRPHDGSGWTTWQISPDSARGANWGPEAVDAPFAWGCSVGDTLTRVGIVDDYFYNIADLNPNVLAGFTYSKTGDAHGTEVASIAAAVGNNSRGISGMMWTTRAVLDRYTDSVAGQQADQWPRYALIRAGIAGSRVINLSAGIHWLQPPNDTNHLDNEAVAFDSAQLRLAMDSLNTLSRRPLFVLAAGNDSIDARWNGYPALAQDPNYRGRIMVIAGSSRRTTNHLYGPSDFGSLVDLAAPADSVTTLSSTGAIVAGEGTSLAAPFVTGTAGLLWSFLSDSTILADSIRAYMLHGASKGGRTAGPFYILNAYESLKLAARRHGARLCANLVFAQGNRTLSVLRNDSTNDVETLVSGIVGEPYLIQPAHLGNYIAYYADSLGDTVRSYPVIESIMNGHWQTTPSYGANPPDTLYLPAFRMSNDVGRDHDGDHIVTVQQSHDSLDIYFDFSLKPSAAIVNTPCCIAPQAILNAAGTEAWITGYGFPILNNDSVWNAYVYKVQRATNATPTPVATIPQAQIYSFRAKEDGSGFYVDLYFQTNGTGLSTCKQELVDTTWKHFTVIDTVQVQTGTLCALKNMGESSERVAWRPPGPQLREAGPRSHGDRTVSTGIKRQGSH
jgi:hypothetical protein